MNRKAEAGLLRGRRKTCIRVKLSVFRARKHASIFRVQTGDNMATAGRTLVTIEFNTSLLTESFTEQVTPVYTSRHSTKRYVKLFKPRGVFPLITTNNN